MKTTMTTKMLFLVLLLGQSQANDLRQSNDLIFRHGFEQTVLISGTAIGNSSSGLVLHLATNDDMENLAVNPGPFSFLVAAIPGANYEVTIESLPNQPSQQSCTLSQASGQVPVGGVNDITVKCDNTPWHWDAMDWDEGGWQ